MADNNNNLDNNLSPDVVELAVCDSCGVMVPVANLQLHQVRACPNRKLPAATARASARDTETTALQASSPEVVLVANPEVASDSPVASAPPAVYDTIEYDSSSFLPSATAVHDSWGPVASPQQQPTIAAAAPSLARIPVVDGVAVHEPQRNSSSTRSNSSPSSPWHQRLTSNISNLFCHPLNEYSATTTTTTTNNNDSSSCHHSSSSFPGARSPRRSASEVINLTHDDEEPDYVMVHDDDDDEDPTTWACPQCTLLNSNAHAYCQACLYQKERDRAATRSHTRQQQQQQQQLPPWLQSPSSSSRQQQQHSTQNVAIGGAVLGGVLGAASAMVRGRPITGAALDGAMNGAIGSVFLNDILGPAAQQHQAGRITVTTRGGRRSDHSQHGQPTAYRRTQSANATTTTRSSNTGSSNRQTRNDDRMRLRDWMAIQAAQDDLMMHHGHSQYDWLDDNQLRRLFPLGSNMAFGSGQVDVSRMSYEELLRRFGDGSENRGASRQQIQELPVQSIHNTSQLGEGGKECSICLEEFQVGDNRMTLPCLHGFHENCAKRWLQTNGSCPICKHRVGGG